MKTLNEIIDKFLTKHPSFNDLKGHIKKETKGDYFLKNKSQEEFESIIKMLYSNNDNEITNNYNKIIININNGSLNHSKEFVDTVNKSLHK